MNAVESEVSKFSDVVGVADFELFSMKTLCVFEVIRWLKGAATSEGVATSTHDKQISFAEVQVILDILLQKKCIKKKDNYFIALTDTIFTENLEDLTHVKMYQMFSNFRKKHISRKY